MTVLVLDNPDLLAKAALAFGGMAGLHKTEAVLTAPDFTTASTNTLRMPVTSRF